MRCEHCRERDAVIHLTQIQNSQVTTLHLCEACAAEKGVETGTPSGKFPLHDFLASLGKSGTGPAAEAEAGVPCPACGATLKDFRQTGRLGCAECYRAFDGPLRDLLRRLHGSATHVGERYLVPAGPGAPPAPAPAAPVAALADLRERLRRAVETEDFELAAELRDRIRVLE